MKLINQKVNFDYCIGQDEKTKEYILAIMFQYNKWYFRYYHISKEEYDLFETDRSKLDAIAKICFQEGFNNRFVLSEHPRDYLDGEIPEITFYKGMYCEVKEKFGKTILKPAGGYSPKVNELGFVKTQYGEYELEVQKITCPSCKRTWFINNAEIPKGQKYEVHCLDCLCSIMLKKI